MMSPNDLEKMIIRAERYIEMKEADRQRELEALRDMAQREGTCMGNVIATAERIKELEAKIQYETEKLRVMQWILNA